MDDSIFNIVFWGFMAFLVVDAFGGFYFFMSVVLASSGWTILASEFPSRKMDENPQKKFAFVKFGDTFSHFATVAASDNGLLISCPVPLLYHKDILIPWSSVIDAKITHKDVGFTKEVEALLIKITTSKSPLDLGIDGSGTAMIASWIQVNQSTKIVRDK